jgi:hypothetical protein
LPTLASECLAPPPAKHNVFKTVDLQAPQVKLDPLLDFERVSIGPAITTVKFTEAELKAVGGSRIVEQNGKSFVVKTVSQPWPLPSKSKLIPLDAYVDQLNAYESFLNKLGCTLRQGPLAINKNSPNANSTCCGVLYRLKKRRQIDEQDMRKQIFFDPGIYERGERFRVFQEERGRTLVQGKRSSRGRILREIELPRGSASGGVRVLDAPMSCVVPHPPLKEAPPAPPSDSNSDLANAMLGANKKATDKATTLTHSSSDSKGTPGFNTVNKEGDAEGLKDEYAASCFYEPDAYLSASWTGISTCTTATDGNGFFDASLCMERNFNGCKPDNFVSLKNSGALHLDVKLFGIPFTILTATAIATYDSHGPVQQPSKMSDGNNPKVVINLTNEEISPDDLQKEVSFIGPQTIVPVGPVPVTIKTGLYARLGINSPNPESFPGQFPKNFPTYCDSNNNKTGTLKMQLGVNAYAALWASASVDAYVAEAGMRADLILADDTFGMFLDTDFTPQTNSIKVSPKFGYKLNHLSGLVILFVDVDLIAYSKRWEVELFKFKGLTAEVLDGSKDGITQPRTFAARYATHKKQ